MIDLHKFCNIRILLQSFLKEKYINKHMYIIRIFFCSFSSFLGTHNRVHLPELEQQKRSQLSLQDSTQLLLFWPEFHLKKKNHGNHRSFHPVCTPSLLCSTAGLYTRKPLMKIALNLMAAVHWIRSSKTRVIAWSKKTLS